MATREMKLLRNLLAAALSASALSACMATEGQVSSALLLPQERHWDMRYGFFLPVTWCTVGSDERVQPARGAGSIYLVFSDPAGRDRGGRLHGEVSRRLRLLGYRLTDCDRADYVLWATVRFDDRIDVERGHLALEGLGPIGGGVIRGTVPAGYLEDVTADLLSGGLLEGSTLLEDYLGLTLQEHRALVVDFQIGLRLDEEAERQVELEDWIRLDRVPIEEPGPAPHESASEATVLLLAERRAIAVARRLELDGAWSMGEEDIAMALTDRVLEGLSRLLRPNRRWY